MNRIALILSLIVLITSPILSQDLPQDFLELLDRSSMTFEQPKGLISVPIIDNNQMDYEFALKYPVDSFEVRFAIRPLDLYIQDYEKREANKNLGDVWVI